MLLEQKLGRNLVSLARMHHVMELIVVRVFDDLESCGPSIRLFKRLQTPGHQMTNTRVRVE